MPGRVTGSDRAETHSIQSKPRVSSSAPSVCRASSSLKLGPRGPPGGLQKCCPALHSHPAERPWRLSSTLPVWAPCTHQGAGVPASGDRGLLQTGSRACMCALYVYLVPSRCSASPGSCHVVQTQGLALPGEPTLPSWAHETHRAWLRASRQTAGPLWQGLQPAHSCLSGVMASVASRCSSSPRPVPVLLLFCTPEAFPWPLTNLAGTFSKTLGSSSTGQTGCAGRREASPAPNLYVATGSLVRVPLVTSWRGRWRCPRALPRVLGDPGFWG